MSLEDDVNLDSVTRTVGPTISLAWENVTVLADRQSQFFDKNMGRRIFGISVNDEPIKILDSVSGHVDDGSLVAIMGPSGAGKTTLLAALARKIELTSGCIRINGCTVSRNVMSKIAGYVPQFDALPSSITAMEYMNFTCALRLDKRTSAKERTILADDIFTELGLLESSDTMISKLSGGEIKRLSLAVEMVTKPKVLFLDEPTTGLDTWTAMRVIESAKAASRSGTLIFCSIHQPAMDLYNMFSHVILLASGKTAYHGTLTNATKFFKSEGFQCPESFNEAEYYVRIISNENLILDSLRTVDSELASGYSAQICNSFSNSTYCQGSRIAKKQTAFEFKSTVSRPNKFVQFYWVMWRILIEMRRTMFQDTTQDFTSALSIFLIGLFYYGVNLRTQAGIQDMTGALYILSSDVLFKTTYSAVYILPEQMPLYLRERSMYTPAVYYFATVIGMIPKAVLHSVILLTVVFFSLDVSINFITFLQFIICITVATFAGTAYGTLMSSWFENVTIATTVMVPFDLIFYMMAGIFYNIGAMPAYLSWMKYLSIFYYTNEAMSITYWTTVDYIECYPEEELPCFKNGREVLAQYGFVEFDLAIDAIGMLLISFGMLSVGYLGVRRRRAVKALY